MVGGIIIVNTPFQQHPCGIETTIGRRVNLPWELMRDGRGGARK